MPTGQGHCGVLNSMTPNRLMFECLPIAGGTIRKCDLLGVGAALLEEVMIFHNRSLYEDL